MRKILTNNRYRENPQSVRNNNETMEQKGILKVREILTIKNRS